MKKFIVMLLSIVLCCGLFTGCGGDNESAAKDTLTVAIAKEPKTLVPFESDDSGTAPITHQYCETLIAVDGDMNLVPGLAKEWEQIDDTHYRFHLREGVKFHDGTPFTAEDVLYTLQKCVESPATTAVVGPIDIANCKVEDEHTIVVALSDVFPAFFNVCTLDIMGIVSKEAMEKDPEGYAAAPVGTGPFKFVEWKTGDYIKMEANHEWWGGEIAFDHLMLRYIPEATTRVIEASSGNADIANITIVETSTVESDDNLQLLEVPGLGTAYVSFNCSVKPFDNVKVRQAISLAIDKEAIVKAVYGEHGEVSKSFLSSVMPGYYDADSEYMKYDAEKAKKLLAEAGYPDGFECRLVGSGDQDQAIAEMIQRYLGEVGITVKLDITDFSNWLDALVNGKQEMYIGGWSAPSGDVSEAFCAFDSEQMGQGGNRSFYKNEQLDNLLKQINKETDTDKRMDYCRELQEILAEECVTIGMNVNTYYWAVSSHVDGLVIPPTSSPDFCKVTFK